MTMQSVWNHLGPAGGAQTLWLQALSSAKQIPLTAGLRNNRKIFPCRPGGCKVLAQGGGLGEELALPRQGLQVQPLGR